MPRVLAEPALEELAAGRPPRPAPAGLARLAASVGNAAFARLARQAAPARERTNLVFIMGADAPDRPGRPANHFYALAREYAARWHGTIVDAPRYRTLAGIFAYLREHPELRVGDLYIVTHANADGDLLFPLDERDADRRVTYPELAESLSAHAEAYRLGGQIDARTTIRIKGCALGQSRGMVELIDQAFGAAERVIAPTHPQNYSRVGGEVVEHYSRMELSLPGDVHLPRAELVARFRDRYPQIPDSFWRRVEGLPVFSRHVRRIHVPGSVEHARGQTGRAEAYAWSPGRHAASGVLTEYRLRRDLPFRVSEEEGEDQRFFTTSFSEPGHPAR